MFIGGRHQRLTFAAMHNTDLIQQYW